ncbi:MAG: DUF2007 domain-containing protein [Thermodesulfobacteriota bacterium]
MALPSLTLVYVALDHIEAFAVTGVLASAGIEARVLDMTITPYPVTLGPLGERRILVASEHAAEARDLLRVAREDGFLREGGIVVEEG